MNYGLFMIRIALLLISYLVAVKKQTWLLAGFNEKNIKNKFLLGKITGGLFFLLLGFSVMIHSFIDYPHEATVLVVAMLVLLSITYLVINRKLLD
ncbi:DUF3784 domain-containing protein [Oceanobacillus alkalisoli]|uniref:DUF3784 domain-containing protein n=1 Tax=Oceanobacillus alkalisoli TaxID=2925113 RepID=UPI001EF11622|nr:DUF3784 domain-containing protein [Oceanobacillus alkalisoli]MCF3943789.1 DUF3784 domain-containing protein [Oceanobacillus alkalisoli]MCG5103729.1 DUF3784 domain-containing protein [Oceanobacillus alkalisoli]